MRITPWGIWNWTREMSLQAVSAFEEALEAAEHHLERLPELQTMTLTNLGIAYARSREYEKARRHF